LESTFGPSFSSQNVPPPPKFIAVLPKLPC
jgi:hypothetical protein